MIEIEIAIRCCHRPWHNIGDVLIRLWSRAWGYCKGLRRGRRRRGEMKIIFERASGARRDTSHAFRFVLVALPTKSTLVGESFCLV